jgi:hypothetical protein
MNTKRLFNQFMARPMTSTPEELSEDLLKPVWEKNFSRRDKAMQDFVRNHRRRQKIRGKLRNMLTVELEKLKDIEEELDAGVARAKQATYKELVAEMNQDRKALVHADSPLQLYKDEEAMLAEVHKAQDEDIAKIKTVVYPFWTIAFFCNSLLLIGYYYQDKQLMINVKKRAN